MKSIFYTELGCDGFIDFPIEKIGEFNQSAYCVTDLFDRSLSLKIKGLFKYVIELHNKPNVLKVHPPDDYTKIAHYHKTFDFDHYFAQPKPKRRKIILETLYEAIVALCEKAAYDLTPFTAAYEKVKELNYENRYMVGKSKISPNRKYKAGIQVEVTEKAAEISVVFEDFPSLKDLANLKVVRTQPHFFFIQQLVNKGKWKGSDTFIVSNKSGEINFAVSLKDKTAEVQLTSKIKNEDELKKEYEDLVM